MGKRNKKFESCNTLQLAMSLWSSRTLGVFVDCEPAFVNHFREFLERSLEILNDVRGWPRAGLQFVPVTDPRVAQLKLRLASPNTVLQLCQIDNMSCAMLDGSRQCLINANRWLYGSRESQLSLDDYRCYVINHEVGHALGHTDHRSVCEDGTGLAPVMLQQTLGPAGCRPNPWPTAAEVQFLQQLWFANKI